MLKYFVIVFSIVCFSIYADGTLDGNIGAGYGAAIATDPAGDILFANPSNGHVDLLELYVADSTNDVFVAMVLNGDPIATTWGKFFIYIETDNPSNGTAGIGDDNGWNRQNIDPDDSAGVNPSFWVGTWTDSGGGANLFQFDSGGPTWGSNIGGVSLSISTNGTTSVLEYQISKSSLGNPNTIQITGMSSGGGSTDGAVDSIPTGNQCVASWQEQVNINSQTSPIALTSPPAPSIHPNFEFGMDCSFVEQYETAGFNFKDGGVDTDLFQIFDNHGVNAIRLRIWHTPAGGLNNTTETLQTALRIKARGMKLLLNFHYSDFWADPGQQNKPAEWAGQTFNQLKTSVYSYTRDVVTALNNQGTLPDMVQIGNEITPGMLWDDGRVGGAFNNPTQWSQFAQLLSEGINGVNDSLTTGQSVKIMIHIDRGGDNAGSRWFFDNLNTQGVNYDVIGLSFYPWWHGDLNDLETNILDLESRYGKEICIVETAYPWTLAWNDSTNNFVGLPGQLLSGYPATVQGQKDFLTDLIQIINSVPNNRGLGLYYWAPEYTAIPAVPTPWENLALFDFTGNLLDSINAFDNLVPVDISAFEIF